MVSRMPADWFTRETHPMLELYCQHVCRSRLIAAELAEFDPESLGDDDGLSRYKSLTFIAEREGRALTMLATRMRMTQQSRYSEKLAASTVKRVDSEGSLPWAKRA